VPVQGPWARPKQKIEALSGKKRRAGEVQVEMQMRPFTYDASDMIGDSDRSCKLESCSAAAVSGLPPSRMLLSTARGTQASKVSPGVTSAE
jgi:hypothetical protein